MKKRIGLLMTIVGVVLLQSCNYVTDIDDGYRYCCTYQPTFTYIPARCVTYNGDCSDCEMKCKMYPVKDKNPVSTPH